MTSRVTVTIVALGAAFAPCPGAAAAAHAGAALVAEGARWWTMSPDPSNPIACATCHHDASEIRGWAAGFPKFRPLPPPHARVMTLVQATAEAARRHYRLADPQSAATAITAYLTLRGLGLPITPGLSAGQPTFRQRLRALERAVAAGRQLYEHRCAGCHREAVVAAQAAAFPRVTADGAQSLEGFLERHRVRGRALTWDGEAMAQLIAYLVSRLTGRPVGLGWLGADIATGSDHDP